MIKHEAPLGYIVQKKQYIVQKKQYIVQKKQVPLGYIVQNSLVR